MPQEEINEKINPKIVKDLISVIIKTEDIISLLDAIGLKVEGEISDQNIGGYIYGISTKTFIIIAEYLNISDEDFESATNSLTPIYDENLPDEEKIDICYDILIRYARIKEN